MEFRQTQLPGLLDIQSRPVADRRGSFTKTFHQDLFRAAGVDFRPAEQYVSVSHKGVIRGMHFQTPPHDHGKLVFCAAGSVLDVVLDLREGSPTFGRSAAFELTAQNARVLYVPSGMAHGFASLADDSIMLYTVGTVYSQPHDAGVRWSSFGFKWPFENPILSDRDAGFPSLADFQTPFRLGGS